MYDRHQGERLNAAEPISALQQHFISVRFAGYQPRSIVGLGTF
jgi:hypothetical protein